MRVADSVDTPGGASGLQESGVADLGGEAPAGLRARAYAASCDFLIVIVVGFGVGKVVEMTLSLAGFQVVSDVLLWPMAFVVGWPYTVLLELHAGGRTIGRAVAGARLIREDGGDLTGALLSFRYLLKVVQIVVGSGLWFGAVVFDSRHRALLRISEEVEHRFRPKWNIDFGGSGTSISGSGTRISGCGTSIPGEVERRLRSRERSSVA